MRDIAIKDIQAIQEYTEAKDIANHAEIRSEMWEAYGEYVQAFAAATTQTERDLAKQAFNSRLQQISNTWNLNDDIVSPGPGSLDSPGNRPGDIRYENTSELRVLFDETLQQFTSLQETSPLFLEPLPQYNYQGPFQYQFPEEGFIPQYVELNSAPEYNELTSHLAVNPNTDLTNEIVTEIIEEVDPDPADPIDPVEPEEPEEPAKTPEEIAAELAQLEAQREGLFDARDLLYITKLQAEALIANNNDRLTILQFDERETVQNTLSVVDAEIQSLRAELNSTGSSEADATRLQDLMRYGETLEGELDRISTEIASLETRNTEAQTALDTANASIASNDTALSQNRSSILALASGYTFTDYTIPTVTTDLPDWSSYEYELPPFNETEVPTSDIVNVVVSTVSLPVTDGSIRHVGAAVSEDGSTIRFDEWGVDDAVTERLEGFEHLYFGSGSDGLRWIYGEASTPEQFALRTGTATFRGGLLGYYAHGSIDSNTVYEDSVFGSLTLNIDFGSNRLTGEGSMEIDNAARSETLSFTLNEAAITQTNDGLTRSLRFSSGAQLLNDVSGNGNFSGAFYGADASEAAGSFAFGLVGGFAAGVWAAGENYVPRDDEGGFNGAFVIGYDSTSNGHSTAWDEGDDVTSTRINYSNGGVEGSVNIDTTLAMAGFNHVSWGTWVANSTTRDALGDRGYWVDVDNLTASSVLQNRTGTAEYAGEIVGGYVSYGNIREDAQGLINLTADFANQSVSGRLQFGRDCSGSGMSTCNVASVVSSFDEPINDYDGNGFGDHSHSGTAGVVAVFGGPNGEEIGGTAWLTEDQGQYIGVFRAGEGLSFGEFVTPTGADSGTDYSNYRGLFAYSGRELVSGDYVTHFTSVVDVADNGDISVAGTTEKPNIADNLGAGDQYEYVSWGQWNVAESGSLTIGANGEYTTFASGSWLVYDPTTDLPINGSATYNGFVNGRVAGGEALGGTINLNADFAADRVTGSMDVTDSGGSWASASFDTSIRRDTDSSGFQGALTGTDVNSGAIFGGFAGPNAEEVGGGWQIDHTDGSSANGIFRATQ